MMKYDTFSTKVWFMLYVLRLRDILRYIFRNGISNRTFVINGRTFVILYIIFSEPNFSLKMYFIRFYF